MTDFSTVFVVCFIAHCLLVYAVVHRLATGDAVWFKRQPQKEASREDARV